ncbi:unnamed protein product, partial [Brassica oleracea var. botrytis]
FLITISRRPAVREDFCETLGILRQHFKPDLRHGGREDPWRRKETAAVELVGAASCGGHVNPGILKTKMNRD